ncbi:GntR family transcriptional regulator [Azospirillum sp. TSO22-1]|uniref:GntR family transcriptional regulator n=1 Tax=Azospirillum sp. TSO22-1 TaxID=716789 RepID=UPI001304D271|nr:GntR family transcriptional regulator [Azospirillum sp. TSO22-1]
MSRPSLTEAAAAQLRELIVTGQLPAGTALTEHALAEVMRISKTPVREALALLRTEGLVTILPHRGTFVFVPDPLEAAPICAHWAILATAALRAAAEHDRAGLAAALDGVRLRIAQAAQRGDERAVIRDEADAQAAIFAHSGNGFLADAHRLIAHKIAAMRVHAGRLEMPASSAKLEMDALFKGVDGGDVEGAAALLSARIERIGAFLGQTLGGGKASQARSGVIMPMVLPFLTDECLLSLLQEVSFYLM